MYYPWLDVPFLTAPAVVALVAIIHVFVSHYAVGGGLLLAMENGRAFRDGDAAYRDYWKKHAKFFIGLTVVFGAITGVGIWWTIGLASPLATEALIRIFVFGWAIEWCFFLLEIVAGFVFYYFWDKLPPKQHVVAGWIYALSAWISLVLITGITSFMLNSSGLIDDWERTGDFWQAFVNVQFLPQTVARTGCALTIGAFYVLLHASIVEKNADVREKVTRQMRLPAFLGLALLVAGVVGWAFFLPESSLATLERSAATNIFAALFVGIVAASVLLLIVGPVAKPRETSVGLALALFLTGIAGIGVAEFVREAVRKPFIVDRLILGNQIYRDDVARLRRDGLLYSGVWTRLYLDEMQEKYPDLKISAEKYLGWEPTRPDYWSKIEEMKWKSDEKPVENAAEPSQDAAPQETSTPVATDSASAFPVRDPLFVRETVAQAPRGGVLPGGGSTVPATTVPASKPNTAAPVSTARPNPTPNLNSDRTASGSTEISPTVPAPTTSVPTARPNPTPNLDSDRTAIDSTEISPTVPAPTAPATTNAVSRPQTGFAPTSTPASLSQNAASPIASPSSNPVAPTSPAVPISAPAPLAQDVASAAVRPSAANPFAAVPETNVDATNVETSSAVAPPSDASILSNGSDAELVPEPGDVRPDAEIAPTKNADSSFENDAETLEERDLRRNGPIAEGNRDLLKLDAPDRRALGRAVFLHHCNDCHAEERGYSAVAPLVVGRSRKELKEFATTLNRSYFYMPPWSGTEVEAELLAEYLASIAPRVPANIYRKPAEKKVPEPDVSNETTSEGVE